MSEYVIQGQTLTGIADAIRAQLGTEQQYTPESMAAAIGSIQGGGNDLAKAVITKTVSDIDLTYDVGAYAFYDCHSINPHFLEGCTSIGSYAFQNCGDLMKSVSANYVISLGNSSFQGLAGVKWVNLPAAQSIGTGCFNNCRALVALIVSAPTLCTLGSVGALSGTPIASGTGYIYVPDNLVTQYQEATNWATYAAQIKGLSEIPAEVQEWLDQQGGAVL